MSLRENEVENLGQSEKLVKMQFEYDWEAT